MIINLQYRFCMRSESQFDYLIVFIEKQIYQENCIFLFFCSILEPTYYKQDDISFNYSLCMDTSTNKLNIDSDGISL